MPTIILPITSYHIQEEGAEEGTSNKEKVTGGWPELRNEELHDLYSTPNIFWVAFVVLYSENSVT
jgi:hypothetical protein